MIRSFVYPMLVLMAFAQMAAESEALALDEDSAEKLMRVERVLLETSMNPATLEECMRAQPRRPRPDGVVSFQNGELTPYHHRTCWWIAESKT